MHFSITYITGQLTGKKKKKKKMQQFTVIQDCIVADNLKNTLKLKLISGNEHCT
jgi:hypothetical protein